MPQHVVVCFNAPVAELMDERAIELHPALQSLWPDLLTCSFSSESALEQMKARPDLEIAEAAKTLPGIKDGQSALEDLANSGKEAVQKLFAAVQQTFSRDADLRGPSPSPSFGR